MPRLRRLTGKEIVEILHGFGFEAVRTRGSHHTLRRVINDETQSLHVPVHGSRPVAMGTIKAIYRQACNFVAEDALQIRFYTE